MATRRWPGGRGGARVVLWAVLAASAVAGGAGAAPPAPVAPASGLPQTAPAGPAAAAAVARAQQLVFANRYAAAAEAFAAAAHLAPDDPDVHAAYALFLAYRHDLAAAGGEARRAVALGPASARAFAVLCRVDDWSNHLDDALAAGRRAVALGDDVLAHLFYAEALSDHGDSTPARAEIAAARRLLGPGSPAYERAEVAREEANLARDLGAVPAEVSAFAAAAAIQPTWVERVLELASADIDAGDQAAARSTLGRAVSLAPDDGEVIKTIADEALVATDYGDAATATDRLVRLWPHDASALELGAQVAMAQRHDPEAARDLLRRALAAAPDDDRAAAYLVFLDRDVERDDALARADLVAATAAASGDSLGPMRRHLVVVDPDAVLAARAHQALAAVNATRARAGLPPVRLDERLSESAAAHSFYWLFNHASAAVVGLGIHQETPGQPGFSGVGPYERAIAQGWHDGPVAEDITHRGSATAAVADWVNSVYHRFPILRPDLVAIGFAAAAIGPLPIEDMEFGFAYPTGRRAAPVVWPADGQTEVPSVFPDDELPDPIPAGGPRTAGYPVTVTFDPYSRVRVQSFDLRGPDGAVVPAYLLSPTRETEMSAALVPQRPLRPDTRYVAHLVGVVDDVAYDRTWSFVTAP